MIKIMISAALFMAAVPAVSTAEMDTAGKTYALIISGINKDPEERQSKDKSVIKLRKILHDNVNLPSERVKVLTDKDSFVREATGISSLEILTKTIEELALTVRPQDRFIFYYIGQANAISTTLRINLPGEDITHEPLAELINKITASKKVIILDCPHAGLAVKELSGPNQIVICGARGDQPYSPHFSEYFVPALIDGQADTNSDGKISLLEAFTVASEQIESLYRSQNLLKTENPILEDDGNGIPSQQPWRYETEKNDGLIVSTFFLITKEQGAMQNEKQ